MDSSEKSMPSLLPPVQSGKMLGVCDKRMKGTREVAERKRKKKVEEWNKQSMAAKIKSKPGVKQGIKYI